MKTGCYTKLPVDPVTAHKLSIRFGIKIQF